MTVLWPDDRQQVRRGIRADSTYLLNQQSATALWTPARNKNQPQFSDITATSGLDFVHREADFVDYNQNPLLKQMYSRLGPALAVGDANGDGLDDVYLGGAIGQGGKLYFQNKNGSFTCLLYTSQMLLQGKDGKPVTDPANAQVGFKDNPQPFLTAAWVNSLSLIHI